MKGRRDLVYSKAPKVDLPAGPLQRLPSPRGSVASIMATSAYLRTAPSRRRCACGVEYGRLEWNALVFDQRIEAPEVARLVAGWPANCFIEVRICVACGRQIAARCDA